MSGIKTTFASLSPSQERIISSRSEAFHGLLGLGSASLEPIAITVGPSSNAASNKTACPL